MNLKGDVLNYGLREYAVLGGMLVLLGALGGVLMRFVLKESNGDFAAFFAVLFGITFVCLCIVERKHLFDFTLRKRILMCWYSMFGK